MDTFKLNENFYDIMNLLYEINEVTGLNQKISMLDIEPTFYEQCLNFNANLNSCSVLGSLDIDGCDSTCIYYKDDYDV